jgi:hypothetical protein
MATQNMVSTLFDAKLDVRSAFLPRRGALYLAVLQGTQTLPPDWRRLTALAPTRLARMERHQTALAETFVACTRFSLQWTVWRDNHKL